MLFFFYTNPEQKGAFQKSSEGKIISTSFVERQNLIMGMRMRRFTRHTNAFSKKIENHCYAIALHFVYCNFIKIHKLNNTSSWERLQAGKLLEPIEPLH